MINKVEHVIENLLKLIFKFLFLNPNFNLNKNKLKINSLRLMGTAFNKIWSKK